MDSKGWTFVFLIFSRISIEIFAQQTFQCIDDSRLCSFWAGLGECSTNAAWMLEHCKISCNLCSASCMLFIFFTTSRYATHFIKRKTLLILKTRPSLAFGLIGRERSGLEGRESVFNKWKEFPTHLIKCCTLDYRPFLSWCHLRSLLLKLIEVPVWLKRGDIDHYYWLSQLLSLSLHG